jgi:multidrug/hemolysin transport system ATP-binding protein
MKDVILKVENLYKKFGDLVAVNHASFEVERGSFFAFLGPNGAGKSTTIKMITTLLKPNEGAYFVNGKNDDTYVRSKIGVVFQENTLDKFLTVKENLLCRGSFFIEDKTTLLERYEELKQLLDFGAFEHKQFRYLSGGQKRRVEIAKALFGNPDILLLDEPTTGLDPESRRSVWSIIETLQKDKNLTVFLTTHYMEEANNADYVVIINKGNIVASGTPNELKQKYASNHFTIVPKNKTKLLTYLKQQNIAHKTNADYVQINQANTKNSIHLLKENEANIVSFEFMKGSMDDVFLEVIKE